MGMYKNFCKILWNKADRTSFGPIGDYLMLFLSATFIFFTRPSAAHPAYGLLVTPHQEVYFSDVLHGLGTIWRIDHHGKLSQVLTGEHSHFLFLDQQGMIWGTNHEYLPATDKNRNTLWRWHPLMGKQIIITPTYDPRVFSGVNFVVDSDQHIYFNTDNVLYVRSAAGSTRQLHPHRFGRIISLQMDDQERIYIVDNNAEQGSIFRLDTNGDLERVADHLLDDNPPDPPFPEPRFNMLFAAFVDSLGHIYVANSGSRRVTAIDAEGNKRHIYHSQAPWYPVAYAHRDGIAYVMEAGFIAGRGNIGPRIVRIRDGNREVIADTESFKAEQQNPQQPADPPPGRGHGWWLLLPLIIATLAALIIKEHSQKLRL